ncbi:MAG: hypothetical protein LBF85_08655 [Tannerella sp.]|jgi:hypothetical protein|nr:hypothetical protein [Tannerella sp.]
MSKWYLILCLALTSICLQAQPPQGRGARMGGGNRQGPPPGMGQRGETGKAEEQFRLDSFPEIPGITLAQRADIGIVLTGEQKDIFKYVREKHKLMDKDRQSPGRSEKEKEKTQKNIAAIDGKIRKRIGKSDRKIRKILSDEQYRVFLEKRKDFLFVRVNPPGFRPPENRRPGERQGGGNPGFRQ